MSSLSDTLFRSDPFAFGLALNCQLPPSKTSLFKLPAGAIRVCSKKAPYFAKAPSVE